MSVSEKLKKAVLEKDLVSIRDGLWSRIALDPNFTKGFSESWNYCIENGISESDLFEKHDGRPMSDEITNESFSALCGELSTNFSKERLDKIKEIGRKLYPPTEEKPHSQTSGTQNNGPQKNCKDTSAKQSDGVSGLFTGLAIGAVAGGFLSGLIFGKAIAVGVGAIVGTAIGGIVGATQSKR